MATEQMLGKRRASALRRIEKRLETVSNGQSINLPRFSRFGNDHLLVAQLETIADFLDSLTLAATAPSLKEMTLDELKTLATGQGIDFDAGIKKPALIKLIEAADLAAVVE